VRAISPATPTTKEIRRHKMVQLATLRKEFQEMDAYEKEQLKRYLLDFLAGLVLLFMRNSHPVAAVLISVALVLFTINPNHWDIRNENGNVDTHYIIFRLTSFGAAGFFHKLFLLITSGS
jgi:hypothetical protein